MKADLHVHTTASDGKLTPREIVELAVRKNIDVISITDHDTVEGLGEALAAAVVYPSLSVIPGIEISTDVPSGEVHMLGYFIDFTDKDFLKKLNVMRSSREQRARAMVKKLADLGMPVKWTRVCELAGEGTVGRPHIAEALLEAGYITSFKEAFNKYIGKNGPAYADRFKIFPVDAVQMILAAKGIPVLAHPTFVSDLKALLPTLKKAGLVGMEVYYNNYTDDVIRDLAGLAGKNNLIMTGGTDYHAFGEDAEVMLGEALAPADSVRRLYTMADKYCLGLIEKYSQP